MFEQFEWKIFQISVCDVTFVLTVMPKLQMFKFLPATTSVYNND